MATQAVPPESVGVVRRLAVTGGRMIAAGVCSFGPQLPKESSLFILRLAVGLHHLRVQAET